MEEKMDYRWMTKVAIHLFDNVDDFIVQYQIPEEDKKEVLTLWETAKKDWQGFKQYASNKEVKKVKIASITIEKTVLETSSVKETSKPTLEHVERYRNAKILNRLHQFHFEEENEEELIDKYIDELNYQKAKKLSELISFYEERELDISPNLSIA